MFSFIDMIRIRFFGPGELYRNGFGPEQYMKVLSRSYFVQNMGSPCGWDVSHGEVKIEETDGSCGRKKEHDLPVFVHGSI